MDSWAGTLSWIPLPLSWSDMEAEYQKKSSAPSSPVTSGWVGPGLVANIHRPQRTPLWNASQVKGATHTFFLHGVIISHGGLAGALENVAVSQFFLSTGPGLRTKKENLAVMQGVISS